jgi:hypothetical protein
MQDFLVTIIIAWILFRLFRPVVFVQPQKHEHHYYSGSQNASNEGEIKITKPSPKNKSDNSDENSDYIDFEELPK